MVEYNFTIAVQDVPFEDQETNEDCHVMRVKAVEPELILRAEPRSKLGIPLAFHQRLTALVEQHFRRRGYSFPVESVQYVKISYGG